jgi:hypothetical protein
MELNSCSKNIHDSWFTGNHSPTTDQGDCKIMFNEIQIMHLVESIIYSVLGLAVFALAFVIFDKITPFSVTKEIEEDQNVALAIMFGSVIIGLAIIIAAAIS